VVVAFSGSLEGWMALEQAIHVAQKENARIQGLHVHTNKATADHHPEDLAQAFTRRCAEAGIQASLSTTEGDVANAIVERGLLNDLIVLNVTHPPEPGLPGLGSGLRAIISRAARPILTIPGRTSPMDRILVGYDGSQKSHEALFVATYLAEKWQSSISVLTLENNQKRGQKIQQQARAYLELHEIQANYILQKVTRTAFLEVIEAEGINLVALGSYGRPAWREIFVGSTVNELLREARCALLICR
jgi:nucleotide-binding universal stress UspA family protein